MVTAPAGTSIGPLQRPPRTVIVLPPLIENSKLLPAIPFRDDLQTSSVPSAAKRRTRPNSSNSRNRRQSNGKPQQHMLRSAQHS